MPLVSQRIHRLPEALVDVSTKLAIVGEPHQRVTFPRRGIACDPVYHARIQDEETAIDPPALSFRLFLKRINLSSV